MSFLPLHEIQGKRHLLWVDYVDDIKHGESVAQGHNGGGDVVIDNFLVDSNQELLVTLNIDHKKYTRVKSSIHTLC